MSEASKKRPRHDSIAQQDSGSKKSHEKWNNLSQQIQNANTALQLPLEVIQQVLLDILQARKNIADIAELASHSTVDNTTELMESVGEKAECAEQKLVQVHNYLMEAFDSKLEIVLHKAQYGEKAFPLENLQDVPLKKIFHHLGHQDLKNIRLVSKRLSEIVVELRPEFRAWAFDMEIDQTQGEIIDFLGNLTVKGITSMKKFKLYIYDVISAESLDLVEEWQDYVYGLGIKLKNSMPFHLKNLEELSFWDPDCEEGEFMIQTMNAHCSSLKRLNLTCPTSLEGHCLKDLPHLKFLGIHNRTTKSAFVSLLNTVGRNITVLDLFVEVDLSGIDPADLRLPSLKQLCLDSSNNVAFLLANSEHLEILTVLATSHRFVHSDSITYPAVLPRLKVFACNYRNTGNILAVPKLLKASATSLQHLVLHCKSSTKNDHLANPFGHIVGQRVDKMEKLETFMFDHISRLSSAVIHQSSETLQFISVGMEDNYYKELDGIHDDLPRLKEIELTFNAEQFISRQGYFHKLEQSYPHAQIRITKIASYADHANRCMKMLGYDNYNSLDRYY